MQIKRKIAVMIVTNHPIMRDGLRLRVQQYGIFYMDVNLTYTVPVPGELTVYGEVSNALDRAPPTTPLAFGRTGSVSLNPQLYDVIGRRYVLGVRYEF